MIFAGYEGYGNDGKDEDTFDDFESGEQGAGDDDFGDFDDTFPGPTGSAVEANVLGPSSTALQQPPALLSFVSTLKHEQYLVLDPFISLAS
jgi:Domain of unknown function (DUF5102)